MSANALLLWMSARRQGSWQQFRAAVEELHVNDRGMTSADDDDAPDQFALPLYQELRLNLQRLGHAEFFAGAGGADWRVSPPSLAVTQTAPHGWLGVLAGARSPRLLQRLNTAGALSKLQMLVFPACPDQILVIEGGQEELSAVADGAGLLLQRDAPKTLLACLPPIDDPSLRNQFELPFGADWRIDRFSSEDLRWHPATRDDARSTSGGLFRFSLRHQRYMLFCSRGSAFRVPGQIGKFLVLRRRRRFVLRYDASSLRLLVPSSCRPPFLVERALILCSGLLPSYQSNSGTGTLEYAQIPESIARTAAALLRQELR
jgi:hypothetical protein